MKAILIKYGFIAAAWLISAAVLADDLQPNLINIVQNDQNHYTLQWRKPMDVNKARQLQIDIDSPARIVSQDILLQTDALTVERYYLSLAPDFTLTDLKLRVIGLERVPSATIVRVELDDGSFAMQTYTPQQSNISFENINNSDTTAISYLKFGIEHILIGLDHLLFVMMLVLLHSNLRQLFWTITSFTAAHSLTLTATALGWLSLPGPPTEALIALSIVFLAAAVLNQRKTSVGKADKVHYFSPVKAAFIMGLLHGLGFAGALSEVGLPADEKLLALALFNIGVEIGQILFVLTIILLWYLLNWILKAKTKHIPTLTAYCGGSLAAFWVIERLLKF